MDRESYSNLYPTLNGMTDTEKEALTNETGSQGNFGEERVGEHLLAVQMPIITCTDLTVLSSEPLLYKTPNLLSSQQQQKSISNLRL